MSGKVIFRCPVVAMDEWVPSLTLEQWARGDTDPDRLRDRDDPEDVPPYGYGGFEPGEIVPFHAARDLGTITVAVENGKAVEVPLPPGTTRVMEEGEPDCQGDRLSDLDFFHNEAQANIVCLADDEEFWRCTGRKADAEAGAPDTRGFEPATLKDWVDQFDKRYCGYGDAGKAARASMDVAELSALVWRLKRALNLHPELNTGSPEARQPELPLAEQGGEA
ncbi:MAG: hypothetical protein ACXIVO_13805 [Glycocaulis sp.]